MVHNNSEFSGFFLMDRQKRWKWARLVMLTLTLALMLPGNAFARERDAVFELERLDAGLMMNVYSEEDPAMCIRDRRKRGRKVCPDKEYRGL